MKKLRNSGAFVRLEIIDGIQLVLAGFQSFSVTDYTDVVIFIDLFKYGLCILNVLNGRIDDLIKNFASVLVGDTVDIVHVSQLGS